MAGGVIIPRRRFGYMGWRRGNPDKRDLRYAATAGVVVPPEAFVPDAETKLPPIRDQGDQGSCTGFTTRTAMQYVRARDEQIPEELSPRFAYYNARVIEGTAEFDAGATIRDVIKGVAKLGISSEANCPYIEDVYSARPSPRAYRDALDDVVTVYKRVDQTEDVIKQALFDGNPIAFGFTVFESFMDWDAFDEEVMPDPDGDDEGGHAGCMVGYDPRGVWIANSWGTEWGAVGPTGERGYYVMPWHLVTDNDFADDLWTVNDVS